MPHRVLVVEDNAPFRQILCELLRQRGDVQIVGEAEDGMDAIRQAEALLVACAPDCRLAIALVDDDDEQVGEGAGAPESHAAADGADYRSPPAVDRHAAADVDSHGMSGRPLRRRADHSWPQRRHVYHAMTHVLSAAGATSRPQKGHEVTAVAGRVVDMPT